MLDGVTGNITPPQGVTPLKQTSTARWWQQEVTLPVAVLGMAAVILVIWFTGVYLGNRYFWTNVDASRMQQQLAYYQQMVREHPDEPQYRVYAGFAYYELKDYTKAAEQYKVALEIDPSFYPAYLNLGYALYMLERYDDALDALQRAVEINPQDFKAHLNLGIVFTALQMYEQAVNELGVAQELNPGAADVHYYAGQALEKSGSPADARKAYQKALDFDPNYLDAAKALRRLGR